MHGHLLHPHFFDLDFFAFFLQHLEPDLPLLQRHGPYDVIYLRFGF